MIIIYEHTRPTFAVLVDDLQWILAKSKVVRKDGREEWQDRTYHPNISNLLDELVEQEFRRQPKKIDELKKLDERVRKVYRLIDRVSNDMQVAAEAIRKGLKD